MTKDDFNNRKSDQVRDLHPDRNCTMESVFYVILSLIIAIILEKKENDLSGTEMSQYVRLYALVFIKMPSNDPRRLRGSETQT